MHREGREETLLGMKRLQTMAFTMRDAIERGDVEALGGMLHEAFLAKKQMNPHITEHTPIERMLEAARDAGASGGKICGAGGGGYLLIAAGPGVQPAVRAALEAAGGQFAPFSFRAEGVRATRGSHRLGPRDMSRRFALLDRDGTIIVERNHLDDPEQVELIPGAAAAIVPPARGARARGGRRDEPGPGRAGSVEPCAARVAVHVRLEELLREEGASLDGLFVCPHAPEEGCACRKPAPGMALEAAARFGFDLARAFVVGDHPGDMGLGRAVGATTIFVLTGSWRR